MKDLREQTYYELLDIEPSATQEEILKAYNKARITYSSNSPALYSLMNKEEAQEILKLIDEAYSVLSNHARRKQYDENDQVDIPLPSGTEMAAQSFPYATISTPQTPPVSMPAIPPSVTTPKPVEAGVTATTRFGSYKKDASFENEIKNAELFDGTFLQKIRLYKNVTLDQLSDSTKISRSYLDALEGNEYGSLPAPVFVRGFLVQYAKCLGLDENRIAQSYMKLMKEKIKR
ncbi:MAG: helix-turn-helix domain-containing protein [Oligoflexia bacterium]|nr:helix-turn-helix domain-containing protein [Oligoflexia bacterium]